MWNLIGVFSKSCVKNRSSLNKGMEKSCNVLARSFTEFSSLQNSTKMIRLDSVGKYMPGLTLFVWVSRLEEAGYGMGLRVLELQTFRERLQKRKVRLLPMLQWVSSNVWKASPGNPSYSHSFWYQSKKTPFFLELPSKNRQYNRNR